jgi:hypothetical protein|uniref:Uncharacterized protein n=1 Tax=Sipha flava TaxID=143950 RepID=A0A2S2Q2B8_9HEMI
MLLLLGEKAAAKSRFLTLGAGARVCVCAHPCDSAYSGRALALRTNQSKFETVTDKYSRRERNRKKHRARYRIRTRIYINACKRISPLFGRGGPAIYFPGEKSYLQKLRAEMCAIRVCVCVCVCVRATRIETMVIKRTETFYFRYGI